MNGFDWRSFLETFSLELLSDDQIRAAQPPEVIKSNWMGFEGASGTQIESLENRLGILLPPSYKGFLRVSNGWRHIGYFIYRLWSTEQVAWFKERNRSWIDAYVDSYIDLPPISDEQYYIYGEEQSTTCFRTEYLQTALEISEEGDSAICLLNPQVISPQREWEAWFFSNWHPGAVRYRSFQELMEAERRSFLELRKLNASENLS